MLKLLLIALLYIFPLHFTQAFDCSHATIESHCQYMSGCDWTNDECTGTWKNSCNPPSCSYIYPGFETHSQNPTGSIDDPFKDLD